MKNRECLVDDAFLLIYDVYINNCLKRFFRYKCSFCEKTFSDKGACNSHEKVHTKSEHSNCEVCGKHFARKQKLKYHMRQFITTGNIEKLSLISFYFRQNSHT